MRLPRLVEADPRGPQLLQILTTHTKPLWPAGGLEVPAIELGSELAEVLRSAERAGQVVRGLEGAERALAAEERGLGAAQGAGQAARCAHFTPSAACRRRRRTLLSPRGDTAAPPRPPGPGGPSSMWKRTRWASSLFGPGRLVRLLMIVHKEAVGAILLAMTGQGEGAEGGRAEGDRR